MLGERVHPEEIATMALPPGVAGDVISAPTFAMGVRWVTIKPLSTSTSPSLCVRNERTSQPGALSVLAEAWHSGNGRRASAADQTPVSFQRVKHHAEFGSAA
jgi:hypothetical protein